MSGVLDKLSGISTAQKIAIALVAKDAVGCVMYTSTARRNKQYTPEKRANVANYDLANGVINIALQLLAIRPIESFMKKLADTKLMKKFFNNIDEKLASNDGKVVRTFLKNKANLITGSVALMSVVICQYIIKRFLAPYASMPAGEKFEELGLIKPKLYPGETFEKSNKTEKKNVVA